MFLPPSPRPSSRGSRWPCCASSCTSSSVPPRAARFSRWMPDVAGTIP